MYGFLAAVLKLNTNAIKKCSNLPYIYYASNIKYVIYMFFSCG